MAKTERLSVRASVSTREKIMAPLRRHGSQGEVVAIAIDRMYRQEFGEGGPRAAKK